ncbi:HNH endonuclease [Bacillus velezensis]
MDKRAKRLEPTKRTARRLYLTSGNQCAFSGCNEMIIDNNGTLLGEACHIEAAKPDGPRFNRQQSNEDRRGFENLVLLCKKHHKIIDSNEADYTVQFLKDMKRNHERKFADAVSELENSIEDLTEKQSIHLCKTLESLNATLQWGHGEEELEYSAKIINAEAERLRKLVPNTRNLFSIMINRSKDNVFSIDEVQQVANLSNEEFRKHFNMLKNYDFISEVEIDEDRGELISALGNTEGWELWIDIKKFCESKSNDFTVEALINDLNFSILD